MNEILSPTDYKVINIMVGPVGSGKSTLVSKAIAEHKNLVRVSKDMIRLSLSGDRQNLSMEPLVSSIYDTTIEKALMRGFNVVLDTTNCHYSTLIGRIDYYKTLAKVNLIFMPLLSTVELHARNENRPENERVPRTVVNSMLEKYRFTWTKKDTLLAAADTPLVATTVTYNPSLPDCVIIDFDDTIAGKCDRGPFDWKKVGGDYPLKDMISLINNIDSSVSRIFLTGRSEACVKESSEWLEKHFIWNVNVEDYTPLLLMRARNDFRPAVEVKRELYVKHIKDKYNVLAVFDDDSRVIEMFRAEGINTLLTKNTQNKE